MKHFKDSHPECDTIEQLAMQADLEDNVDVKNACTIKLNTKEEEFLNVRKLHDDNEQSLTKQNRLENETKYKIEMLKNAIENGSSLPYAVKAVLDNPKLAGIHGVIGNLVETKKEYSVAISTALAQASNYLVTDDEFTAKEAINYLKTNKFFFR